MAIKTSKRWANGQGVDDQQIAAQAERLNKVAVTAPTGRARRKAHTLKKKLATHQRHLDKYKHQQQVSGTRSGYSTTDPDATAMRMKNDELLPAYNVLVGSEGQFITGYSIHHKTNDGVCFKDHIAQFAHHGGHEPASIIADSIFGTQENYALLDDREIASYMKFPFYQKEQSRKYRNNAFNKDNFPYDPQADIYTCPYQKQLRFRYVKTDRNKNGYITFSRLYECEDCRDCPFARPCKKQSVSNRTIKVTTTLEHYKEQARQN